MIKAPEIRRGQRRPVAEKSVAKRPVAIRRPSEADRQVSDEDLMESRYLLETIIELASPLFRDIGQRYVRREIHMQALTRLGINAVKLRQEKKMN